MPEGQLKSLIERIDKPIYKYNDSQNAIDVITVRVHCQFHKSKDSFRLSDLTWALLTKDKRQASSHSYQAISDNHMRDVFPSDNILRFKQQATEIFTSEFEKQTINPTLHQPRLDPLDFSYKAWADKWDHKTVSYGRLITGYYFYVDVKNKGFKINMTRAQISKICYDDNEKSFLGIHHNPKTNVPKRVELQESWIKDNFGEDYIQYLKSNPTGKTDFLAVPIGSARQVTTTQQIENNPIVKYQQLGQNSCAFASLSSCLHHLHYEKEAQLVNSYRIDYYNQSSKKESHRIMEYIIDRIQHDDRFYDFRSRYMWIKLKSNYNILESIVEESDFRWVSLWSEDGSSNHAVSVVNNFIFDGNCTNALLLSQLSLDECCVDSNFVSIHKGFHFVLKNQNLNNSKNSKNRKKKKEKERKVHDAITISNEC